MKNDPVAVALSLGSNLGDREETICRAVQMLADAGLTEIHRSSFHGSKPVDCPSGAFDFINVAVTATTSLAPNQLLDTCQGIEAALGRRADHGYHENRSIDIDILLYGQEIIDLPGLTVPHPAMLERTFVMAPLAEVAAAWPVPSQTRTVNEFAESLTRNSHRD